jgi:hypothetical protein
LLVQHLRRQRRRMLLLHHLLRWIPRLLLPELHLLQLSLRCLQTPLQHIVPQRRALAGLKGQGLVPLLQLQQLLLHLQPGRK